MNSSAINRKLQELCLHVGLLEDNTLYTFQRAAASQTIDQQGVAAAQELLGHHLVDKTSILYYDPMGMGSTDMSAFRLGGETLSKAKIASSFRESNLALYKGEERSLAEEIRERASLRVRETEEYTELEVELQDISKEIHEALRRAGTLDADEDLHLSGHPVQFYTERLKNNDHPSLASLLGKLDAHLVHRKLRRKQMATAFQKQVKAELRQEHYRRFVAPKRGNCICEGCMIATLCIIYLMLHLDSTHIHLNTYI
jgi:hypothetical protein